VKFRVLQGAYHRAEQGGLRTYRHPEELEIPDQELTDRHAAAVADILEPRDEPALELWRRLGLKVKTEPTVVGRSYTFGM